MISSYDAQTFSTNNANWLSDGLRLTTEQAFLNWYYRALCQMISFFTRQVPSSAQLKFDVDKFRECLSMTPPGKPSLKPAPWPLAPGRSADVDRARKDAADRWAAHKARVSSFIPHAVHVMHEKAERERLEQEREEREKQTKRAKQGEVVYYSRVLCTD